MNNNIYSDYSPFKQYYSNFLKTINNDDINQFKLLTSDEERIQFVFNLPAAHDYQISVGNSSKSFESAKQLKEHGNNAFQANEFKTALDLYTRSILKQPQETASDKQDISLMYANRSAAFYHLGEHQTALEDIESAFECNYPSHLHFKICDRKARCLLALNQLKSAQEAFRHTIQALDVAKLTSEKRQKWQRDIQIMLAMLEKNKQLANAPMKKPFTEKGQLKNGPNKKYPDASNVVVIKEESEVGRYAEAEDEIKPGDLLLRETPHCAVLLDQYARTHCFQCFQRTRAPYPCPRCSNVVFCSKSCQRAALRTHHDTECPVLPCLWQSGASVTCLMALRIITQRDLQFYLALRPTLQEHPVNKIYKSDDYINVYHLVNHSGLRRTEDFLHRTVMAVFLLRCLQGTNYFKPIYKNAPEKANKGTLTEEETFIGGLILRHLQSLQFNSHEVSELVITGKKGQSEKRSVFIGGAVYPTLALFNHSCNPGIVRYHKGTEVVVRAIRTIRSGEMVAENYGPIFTQVEVNERQNTLRSQYWFDCHCEACEENWPVIDNISTEVMRFRCDCGCTIQVPVSTMDFMVPCHSCNKHTNILKGLKVLQDTDMTFRVGKSLMDEGKYAAALPKFIELLTLLDTTLVPPFKDYHICQQQIRTCLLSCGNMHVDLTQ